MDISDHERSRSPSPTERKIIKNDTLSPRNHLDSPPHNNKPLRRSYSRSPSRSRKMSYRIERRDDRGDRPRYRSRSRSRSLKRYRSRYSHSRSRSHSRDRNYRRNRSHSKSPMSSRKRHVGTRDNPTPSKCLGVFGLSIYTTEEELNHIFSKYGPVGKVQVVIDAKTGRSRGFAFVYFESTEDAKVAKEQCTGMKISGKSIRVDYSITQRAHTPTPGIYMGKPTYFSSERWDRGRRERDDYYGYRGYRERRSPSPYFRRRRYDRSRSRSYSPRRY